MVTTSAEEGRIMHWPVEVPKGAFTVMVQAVVDSPAAINCDRRWAKTEYWVPALLLGVAPAVNRPA
jgi:hypothetical protein